MTAPAKRLEFHLGSDRYPCLRELFEARDRVTVIIGPLGSGKTFTVGQRLLYQMCEQVPNKDGTRLTRWLVIRNTYNDLMGTTYKDFREVFEGLGRMKMGGMEPPTFTCDFMIQDGTRVRSEVIFLALDRDDAIKKLRGYQLTGGWLSEMKELQKSIVDMLDGRLGRYPSMAAGGVMPSWHGMIGDTNAPDEDHWLYKLAEEDRPDNWHVIKQPGGVIRRRDSAGKPVRDSLGKQVWDVNPDAENLANLVSGYYEAQIQAKSEEWIAVNLANEYGFTIDGKPVFPEYHDSVHFFDELAHDPNYPIVLGFDFGRTPAMAVLQYISTVDRWHWIDELVSADMSASVFRRVARAHLDREYPNWSANAAGWGDPAGDHAGQTVETTPIDMLRAEGIPVNPAPSNQRALRHAALSGPLTRLGIDGRPAFLVGPKVRIGRKGLMGGFCFRRLKVSGDERFTDQPDKNEYSHVCFVAGTLISTPQGPVPIETLRVGDEVLTPMGPKPIVFAASREADVLDVETDLGRLTCTPDHPFMTPAGYVPAEDLDYAEVLHEESPIATARRRRVRASAVATRRRERVYNITVAHAHCYYAGGILVSNCEAAMYACLGGGEGQTALRSRVVSRRELPEVAIGDG